MLDLKAQLKKGALAIGTMISEIRNPNLAYMLARCGFDFFIIDNEHGSYSPETISDIIAASRGAGISTIVRIPANFPPSETATREISGMGTPDLTGTYGTFSFFTTDDSKWRDKDVSGGKIYPVNLIDLQRPFLHPVRAGRASNSKGGARSS